MDVALGRVPPLAAAICVAAVSVFVWRYYHSRRPSQGRPGTEQSPSSVDQDEQDDCIVDSSEEGALLKAANEQKVLSDSSENRPSFDENDKLNVSPVVAAKVDNSSDTTAPIEAKSVPAKAKPQRVAVFDMQASGSTASLTGSLSLSEKLRSELRSGLQELESSATSSPRSGADHHENTQDGLSEAIAEELSSPAMLRRTSKSNVVLHDKRRLAVTELLETELHYVKLLETVVDAFANPLFERLPEGCTLKDVACIFGQFDSLLENHRRLLSSLERACRVPCDTSDGVAWDARIGEFFTADTAEFLLLYSEYVSSYEAKTEALQKCRSASTEFSKRLRSIENSKRTSFANLESFLIEPVQRIARYPMLLERILRATDPSEADFDELTLAFENVESVCKFVNSTSRRTQSAAQIRTVLARVSERSLLQHAAVATAFGLQSTSNRDSDQAEQPNSILYFAEGPVRFASADASKDPISGYCFLFDKFFLLCRESRTHRLFGHDRLKIKSVVPVSADLVVSKGGSLLSFSVVTATSVWMFTVTKAAERSRWVERFRAAALSNTLHDDFVGPEISKTEQHLDADVRQMKHDQLQQRAYRPPHNKHERRIVGTIFDSNS